MKKVEPLIKKFETAREQAEYYFDREFNAVPFELLKPRLDNYEAEILYPSDDVFLEDFKNENDIDDFNEKVVLGEYDNSEFDEFLKETDEFKSFKDDRLTDYYPMWNWVFSAPQFYIDSDYMDVDKLYQLGIGVIDDPTGYYLFISGAGYDFYDAHWIPLFRELGWIKEIEN